VTLFRPEVIEAKRRRLWGDVRLSQPPSLSLWTLVLGGTAIAVIIALACGTYIKKESVAGYVSPESGIVQVSTARTGRIIRVMVSEGDHVNADAPLIEFSGETVGAQTGQVLAAQLVQIEQQIESAAQRRIASGVNLDAEGQRLRLQLAAQTSRRKLLASRIEDQKQMLQISEGQSQRLAELAKSGYISEIQYAERRQQMLSQRSELSSLLADLAGASGAIAELRSQIGELPARSATLAASAELDLSTLQQKRIELSASRRYVERAPVAGVVSSMQARPGGMPPTNTPLVSIMPDGSELLAELLVPTRAAGFIKPGDEVRLQVDAYPFERFGFVMGNVASVSHSVMTPGEFLAPIEIKEAVYRVRVALSRDFVMAYGKKAQLRPGMSLRADIIIDRKPLWRQLIDPMLAAAKRAH
jgi:membrane fusion protein